MRIISISDTHGLHDGLDIPDGDILVHAGDMTSQGRLTQIEDFNEWFGSLPHKYKIAIAGNHDWALQRQSEQAGELLASCIYLQDKLIEVEGIKFYGSPWQPEFFNWAFNLPRGKELKSNWENIPDKTDVLITHCPPFGILDKVISGENVGCEDLKDRIDELNLKVHIFGHIHESHGIEVINSCKFVNASICNRRYLPWNKPIIIDI
jgi:Icc-related predicted phosphoesterase